MTMKEAILGISAYYHDSAAAQEERFPRTKHNSRFPIHACQYVLEEAGLDYNDLQAVAFYDKPLVKFERVSSRRTMPSRRAASGALRRPFPCGSKKALHEAPARRAARPSVTPRSRSIPGKVTLGDSIVYGNTAKLNGGLAQSACAAKGLHENMRCILVITYPRSLGNP